MKRRFIYILLIVVVALSACNDDYFDDEMSCEDGYTYINFQINDPVDIETRSIASSNERNISDAYLLVFNKDNTYKEGKRIVNITGNGALEGSFKVEIRILKEDKVVMLANTGIAIIPTGITLENINEKFPSTSWNINQGTTYSGKGMPMSGKVDSWTGVQGGDKIILKRSVAKIQLDAPSDLFSTTGIWTMRNHPTQGAIYQSGDIITVPTTNAYNETTNVACDKYLKGSNYSNEQKTLYVPAFPAATCAKSSTKISNESFNKDRPCMIVKRGNYYYRIDFVQKITEGITYQWIDIKPNYHYTVNIKTIEDIGYATVKEAMESPSNNISYDITISGNDDNVVISTGQYALELEYDNLIAYATPRAELTIKARAIIPEGSALPSVNSITSNDFNINYNKTSLSDEEQVFKFNLKNRHYVTEQGGIIKFKLGSITKDINIKIKDRFLDAHCDEKTFNIDETGVIWSSWDQGLTPSISGQQIIIKATENITPESWYNYSTQKESNESDIYAEPVFKVRSLNGHLPTVSGGSRTKVIITQAAPDYVGWAGGEPEKTGSKAFSKRLIIEADERYSISENVKSYETYYWSNSTNRTRWIHKEVINGIPQNKIEYGNENTRILMKGYTPPSHANPNDPAIPHPAAWECWRKNDRNGNGVLETNEITDKPWYLPSQFQMIIVWQSFPSFKSEYDNMIYMTSSELQNYPGTQDDYGPVSAYHSLYIPSGQFHYGLKEGYRMDYDEYNNYIQFYYRYSVRCVKDL